MTEPFLYEWCLFVPYCTYTYDMERVERMQTKFQKLLLREDTPPHPIITSIRDVCAAIDAVQSRFQIENDPDLIEGCIYELESLRAQYRYLLRTARQQGITCTEKAHLWGE